MSDIYDDLEKALVIIVGEYPRHDDRYKFAIELAKKYGLDLGENASEAI